MSLRIRHGLSADRLSVTPDVAEFLYDTDTLNLFIGDGSTPGGNAAGLGGGDAATLNGQPGSYYLARANHTGTQLSSTISDFDTEVETAGDLLYVRLDGSYSDPSWVTDLDWSKITGTPITLAGYGITDALSTVLANGKFLVGNGSNLATPVTPSGEATFNNAGAFTLANSAVIGKILTGLSIAGGSIASTDSIIVAFGKIQNQINGVLGGAIYQGVWNANTNSPALADGVGTKGYYYVVSVAGSTSLDGTTDWKVGDWAIFNGTTWDKVDNTDAVSSVNGLIGAVPLTGTSNRITISAGNVFDISATYDALWQPIDSDLTTIAGLTATTDNFIVSVASAWASRTPAQVKTTLSLNNVENTALSTWAGSTSLVTVGTITTGVWNGTPIANANLANSTISSIALGGTLAAMTATDSTITFSGPYTGAVARTLGLNLGNANIWTALQTIRLVGKQLSIESDASNTAGFTVGSTGSLTIDLVGTSPATTFSQNVALTGGFQTAASASNSNLNVPGASSASNTSSSGNIIFGGATTINFRRLTRGSTNSVLGVGNGYGGTIFGSENVTEALSGTHPLLASVVIKSSTFTDGAAATTDLASLYIEDAPTGITPTGKAYALWIDAGINRFDGIFNAGGTSLTANQIWGANSGATGMEGKTISGTANQITVTHGAGSVALSVPTSLQVLSFLNTGTLTLPTVTGTIAQYVETSIASNVAPTPTGDARENYLYVTALAVGATIAAPTGTPANGNTLLIRILDNGTARNLTWNAIYRASTDLSLPATTILSKTVYIKFIYNSASSTWDLLSVLNNF